MNKYELVKIFKNIIAKVGPVRALVKVIKNIIPFSVRKRLSQMAQVEVSDLERKKKFIYIHIPKCAGNGVLGSMFGISGMRHSEIKQVFEKYNSNFSDFHKVAVVRNPFDRFESAYYYLRNSTKSKYDSEFYNNYIARYSDINEFVEGISKNDKYRAEILKWTHFKPQVDFITVDGQMVLDQIIYFENIEKGYHEFAKAISEVGYPELKKINKSVRPERISLTDKSKCLVRELYEQDFETLGY